MAAAKLLYLVIETSFFVSHRLPLGVAANDMGFDVVVVSDARKGAERVTGAGLRLVKFEIERKGINPLTKLPTLYRLWKLYRKERPDLVHHIALKPILLGGIVARFAGVPRIIASVTGLGFLYIDRKRLPFVRWLIEFLLPRLIDIAIVQNGDDRDILLAAGMPEHCIRLIPGAGVDMSEFSPIEEPEGAPVVMLPARLLWDKGVGEFVTAARILKEAGVDARFVLVGDTDLGNRAGVPRDIIAAWEAEGVVEIWGHRSDMPAVYRSAAIVCLPSYREGLPKTLLEASASGRAIVASDAVGCRDAVVHGETGLLVPVRDPFALADAIRGLLNSPEKRRAFGLAGRERMEREFSTGIINPQILKVYSES